MSSQKKKSKSNTRLRKRLDEDTERKKQDTGDDLREPTKEDKDMGDSVVPVNAEKFIAPYKIQIDPDARGFATFLETPIDGEIVDLCRSIRKGIGSGKDKSTPLDEQDKNELDKCLRLGGIFSRRDIGTAIICAKIEEEAIWRDQGFDNCGDYLCKLLGLEYGAMRRYINGGKVAWTLMSEHNLATLPRDVSPYVPFAQLKHPHLILTAYNAAEKMSSNGKVTEETAKKAVVAEKSKSFTNSGKPAGANGRNENPQAALPDKSRGKPQDESGDKSQDETADKPRKKFRDEIRDKSQDKPEDKSRNKTPDGSQDKARDKPSTSEATVSTWEIEPSRAAIVKHIRTMLKPAIVDYLGAKKRNHENIDAIRKTLRAIMDMLDKAFESKGVKSNGK